MVQLKFTNGGCAKIINIISLPKASSPHGILVTRKFIYILLNDLSMIHIYYAHNHSFYQKFEFSFPICAHMAYTFDDISLYVVDENNNLYKVNLLTKNVQKLTNNLVTAVINPCLPNESFVVNVSSTNALLNQNLKTETGVLIIKNQMKPLFYPFRNSFQQSGVQGVYLQNNFVFVSLLSGPIFGYIDLVSKFCVACQLSEFQFHFIDLRYSDKHDTLFLISSSVVSNSLDALVVVKNFKQKFPMSQTQDVEFNIKETDYFHIMFTMNVSVHRITFILNESVIIITTARAGKVYYFPIDTLLNNNTIVDLHSHHI